MKRRLIIAAVFAGLWVLLWLAARSAYDRLLPGVPDGGRWPIASLPWLLARANTPGRPWTDLSHAIVWSTSVATLLAPIALVVGTVRNRGDRILSCLCAAGLTAWALFTTFRIQYEYVVILKWPRTRSGAAWFVIEPMLWAAAVCAMGWLIGRLAARIAGSRNAAVD